MNWQHYYMEQVGSIVLCFIVMVSTNSVVDRLDAKESLEDKPDFNPISPKCLCPFGLSTENCRIEESANIKPIIFTDPSWDDYSSTSSFKTMENQICEELGVLYHDRRHAHSTKGISFYWKLNRKLRNKVIPTSDEFTDYDSHQQKEPLDNDDIEPYDTPCSDYLCKSYEKCTYKGMGYRCRCQLFKYGELCNKDCADGSCNSNQSCTTLEDCYKCDCNLFKLEQICECDGIDLLISGLVACVLITIIFYAYLGRRREERPITELALT